MKLICPVCGTPTADLDRVCERGCPCAKCGMVLQKTDGIVRALAPGRRAYYERFLDDYSTIRNAEGRGSVDREYYKALPYRDLSGKNSEQWRIRACTYRYLESNLLERTGLISLTGAAEATLPAPGRRSAGGVDIFRFTRRADGAREFARSRSRGGVRSPAARTAVRSRGLQFVIPF
jgi:hypothetical protein